MKAYQITTAGQCKEVEIDRGVFEPLPEKPDPTFLAGYNQALFEHAYPVNGVWCLNGRPLSDALDVGPMGPLVNTREIDIPPEPVVDLRAVFARKSPPRNSFHFRRFFQ